MPVQGGEGAGEDGGRGVRESGLWELTMQIFRVGGLASSSLYAIVFSDAIIAAFIDRSPFSALR